MVEIILLEKDYREAFLYLLYEIDFAKLCFENKRPWFPQDEKRFEKSWNIFKSWHSDPWETPILDLPCLKPREIRKMPEGKFVLA
jgi:hypothetical protein